MNPTNLQSLFLRGIAWKLGSQLMLQLLRLAIVIALARLLDPDQYGIAAMALVIAAFVIAFSDVGLGAALVQRKRLSEADRSTAFWLTLAAGVGFTAATAALAGPIASFYGHHEVKQLIRVLSFTFIINSAGATHRALLAKDMNFRSLEIRTMAGTIVGGGAGIVVAARGGGAWSLIVQELALGATSTLALWTLSAWRPRFIFSSSSLQSMMRFGANTVGSRVLNDISNTADNILIGRFLGSSPLGLYAITYKTVLTPLGRVALPIQEVLFPTLARLQDEPERLREAWLRVTKFSFAIAAPMLFGLMLVTPDFTETVLGSKWHQTIPIMRVLAVVGLAQAMQATGWSAFAARNRTRTQLRFSLFATCTNITAFALGLHWGLVGVATCYAAASVGLLLIYTRLTLSVVDLPAAAYLRALRGVVIAIVVMAVVILGVRAGLVDRTPVLRLFVSILVGAAVFVGTVVACDREIGAAIDGLIRHLGRHLSNRSTVSRTRD